MPRMKRADEAGCIYHVLNRSNAWRKHFHKPDVYLAFLRTLCQGLEKYPVHLLTFCLMPKDWHRIVRPQKVGWMGKLLGWVTAHQVGHAGSMRPLQKMNSNQSETQSFEIGRTVVMTKLKPCWIAPAGLVLNYPRSRHETIGNSCVAILFLSWLASRTTVSYVGVRSACTALRCTSLHGLPQLEFRLG